MFYYTLKDSLVLNKKVLKHHYKKFKNKGAIQIMRLQEATRLLSIY